MLIEEKRPIAQVPYVFGYVFGKARLWFSIRQKGAWTTWFSCRDSFQTYVKNIDLDQPEIICTLTLSEYQKYCTAKYRLPEKSEEAIRIVAEFFASIERSLGWDESVFTLSIHENMFYVRPSSKWLKGSLETSIFTLLLRAAFVHILPNKKVDSVDKFTCDYFAYDGVAYGIFRFVSGFTEHSGSTTANVFSVFKGSKPSLIDSFLKKPAIKSVS